MLYENNKQISSIHNRSVGNRRIRSFRMFFNHKLWSELASKMSETENFDFEQNNNKFILVDEPYANSGGTTLGSRDNAFGCRNRTNCDEISKLDLSELCNVLLFAIPNFKVGTDFSNVKTEKS